MRIFLSLLVLLIFLLVALFSSPSAAKKRGPKGSRTVLLVGPMGAGKTGLWSKVSARDEPRWTRNELTSGPDRCCTVQHRPRTLL